MPSSLSTITGSDFRPLSKIPHCSLLQESGPCLSSGVAVLPLSTAKFHWFGKPLPHQLPSVYISSYLIAIKFLEILIKKLICVYAGEPLYTPFFFIFRILDFNTVLFD